MKKGDYVKAKRVLSMRETFGYQCVGKIEGTVIHTKPYLVIEFDSGDGRGQVGITHEANDQFEVLKEAEDE